MDIPKIYVACLASYNNGILRGAWINADQSVTEIYNEIHKILVESTIENAKEWAIHDYKGFGDIRLSKDEDLETVVKYAKFITEHGKLGQVLIAHYGIDEATTMLEKHYHGAYDSEVDFVWYHSNPISEHWFRYFDCEAFARDLFINNFCSVLVDGKVHVFSRY